MLRRPFLWAAAICFVIGIICVLKPDLLNTPWPAWGLGGALSFILDVLSGGYAIPYWSRRPTPTSPPQA